MNDTYAILVFMRMLSTFNYESGFISDFDENKTFVSINKICKTIGVSTGQIDSIIKVIAIVISILTNSEIAYSTVMSASSTLLSEILVIVSLPLPPLITTS